MTTETFKAPPLNGAAEYESQLLRRMGCKHWRTAHQFFEEIALVPMFSVPNARGRVVRIYSREEADRAVQQWPTWNEKFKAAAREQRLAALAKARAVQAEKGVKLGRKPTMVKLSEFQETQRRIEAKLDSILREFNISVAKFAEHVAANH